MFEARLRVIYCDTDQMGVVYHGNYFRFFEFARSEFFLARGGSYRDMERGGLFLPVIEANCQYKAPAHCDDVLLVRTRVSDLKRVSLTFSYELVRENEPERVLSTGYTTHACVNREGRPTRLPDDVLRLLQPSP